MWMPLFFSLQFLLKLEAFFFLKRAVSALEKQCEFDCEEELESREELEFESNLLCEFECEKSVEDESKEGGKVLVSVIHLNI